MAGRAPRAPGRGPASGTAPRGRFAVVAARFNEPITRRLAEGARRAYAAAGVAPTAIEVHWVAGSFELPQAASHLAATGRYAGIACVGAVIRGRTPHFEHIAREAAAGIREVALRTGVPVTFGLVTALTEAQAWARAGGAVGNRGAEAAEAAVELAGLVARVAADRGRARRERRPRAG